MSRERLPNSAILPLEALPYWTEEQWEENWQDQNFTINFPKNVATLVSSNQWGLFPDEDRKAMVEPATNVFMKLSWKSGKAGSVAGMSINMDENLNIAPGGKGKEFISIGSSGETLGRCLIGSLILLGKSLEDKKYINNILSKSHSDFNDTKKLNFRQHIFRLLRNDSFFRNWVKANNLDGQNNFEWNRKVAELFLQLHSESVGKLPIEFGENLTIYPLEVIDAFVDHAKGYVEKPPATPKKKLGKQINPMVFMVQLDELREAGYFDDSPLSLKVQENIEDLRRSVVKN